MGGCDADGRDTFMGVERLRACHNSFDYTGVLEVVKRREYLADTILLLQDTMLVGNRTEELVRAASKEHWATAAFGGQCNLMLLRMDYVLKISDWIRACENVSKARAIELEGQMWRMVPEEKRGHFRGDCVIKGRGCPYGGAERIEEYYSGLDITKWKANYGQSSRALITTA
jgi:hypothetical protein